MGVRGVRRRALRTATVALCALLLVACGMGRRRDGLEAALAAADAAYRPGTPGFEDEVQRWLDKAAGDAPDRPAMLWRLARLEVARGQAAADPIAARDAYARARAIAARCLDATQPVRRRRLMGDWPAALRQVPQPAEPCVGQLAWAWTRWYLAADPKGASLDRFTLDVLVSTASGREAQWAEALLAGLGGDRRTAETLLVALSAIYPDDLTLIADRIAWVLIPSGDRPAAEALLPRLLERVRPAVPRDVAAARAAERALAGDLGAVPLPVKPD